MNTKRKTFRSLDIKSKNSINSLNVLGGSSGLKTDKAIFYSRGKKTKAFFTEDSKLYITPKEAELMRKGLKLDRQTCKWDSLSSRVINDFVKYRPSQPSLLLYLLEKRYELMQENFAQASQNLIGHFSLVRLWNLSIVGSILFGMVTMTFIYKYLGQGASASSSADQLTAQVQNIELSQQNNILASSDASNLFGNAGLQEPLFSAQVEEIQKASDQAELEREIYGMVKGYPIEKMVPYIAKQDRTVAAFMIAIAKKESNWGRRVPLLDGQDCYNYVGYRGQREKMGTGGHTCFDSPEDAVNTVAKRIATLVEENDRNTPEKMVIWKCGQSCAATGGQAAANKWIQDVDTIFQKFKT
jgi:hypothetical protein